MLTGHQILAVVQCESPKDGLLSKLELAQIFMMIYIYIYIYSKLMVLL